MLENELKDITEQKLPTKNLKQALLALGYAILASLFFYLAIDSFGPGSKRALIWIMIGLYYTLTVVSGIYAYLACKNSIISLKTNKNTRNYVALLIGVLLLIGICRQIFNHL